MKGRILETKVKSFSVEEVWPALICSQLPFSLKQQRVLWTDEPCWLVLPGSLWLSQALPGSLWPGLALSGTAISCSLPELLPDHTELPVTLFYMFRHKGHIPFMLLTVFQLPPRSLIPPCRPQPKLFLQADFQRELLWRFSNWVIMCIGERW